MNKLVLWIGLGVMGVVTACAAPVTPIVVPTATTAPTVMPTVLPTPTKAPAAGELRRVAEMMLKTRTGTSYTLDWSSDGKWLAVGSGFEITVVSADLSATVAVLMPTGGALGITWSPDQKQFATVNGARNRTISLWDWEPKGQTITVVKKIAAGSDQYGAAWSPDGKWLATLGADRTTKIQIWDATTWKQVHVFDLAFANPRRALNWSADSKRIFDAGEANGAVVLFAVDVESGAVEELLTVPTAQADVFAVSPDGKEFVVVDVTGKARILDAGSGKVLHEFQTVTEPADVGWKRDGRTLAILGYKTDLELWSR